jgi:hypothetical protein
MDFHFTVHVTIERTEGKFATKDELQEQIIEALESANPGAITGENDGEYEVTDWEVYT